MPTQEEILAEIALLDEQIAKEEALSPAGAQLQIEEIDAELASRGEPAEPTPLTPDQEFAHNEDIMDMAGNSFYDAFTAEQLAIDTENLKENPVIIPEEGSIEKQTYVDILKELKTADGVAKRLPVFGPLYKLAKMKEMMDAVEVANSPIGTTLSRSFPAPIGGFSGQSFTVNIDQAKKDTALKLVEKWIVEFDKTRNRTTGAKFTNALLEMPAFIVEFMLTGPVFKTGSASAKTAAKRLLGEYAETATGKLAIRAAGAGFGSLARTAVNIPKVLEGAASKMTAGLTITDDGNAVFADAERNPFSALASSFTDLYIENVSEIAGGAIGEGFSFVGRGVAKRFDVIGKFTEELSALWINNAPAGTTRTLKQFLTKSTTKIGFNGILGEFAEERLAGLMRFATGKDTFNEMVPSMEELLIEAGIFSVFGAGNLATEKIFRTDPALPSPIRDTDLLRPIEGNEAEFTERLRNVPLFQSAKNKALADAEMADATKFINDQIAKKPKGKGTKIRKPDDPTQPKVEGDIDGDNIIQVPSSTAIPDLSNPFAVALSQGDMVEIDGVVFHGTSPSNASKIIQSGNIKTNVSKGDKLNQEVVSASKFKKVADDIGTVAFEINKEGFVERGEAVSGDVVEGLEVASSKSIPLSSIKKAHILLGAKESLSYIDRESGQTLREIKSEIESAGIPVEVRRIAPTPTAEVGETERDIKIVTVSTKAKALDGKARGSDITPLKSPFARAVVANIARAEDAVGTWGKAGKKVQKDLREISFRTAVNTGNTTQNIKVWTKGLSKAEKVTVAQLMDGAIPREGQPNRLIQRADAIKKEMDKIQKEAQDLGLRKGELTGRAFPQQLNKEGKDFLDNEAVKGRASDKVYAWAQNQVTDGKFDNVDDAIVALELYRQNRASGREGYIEGQRTLEVDNDFRDWNLDKILAGTIESSWEKIEAARQWGVLKDVKTDAGTVMLPFRDVQKDMALIRAEGLSGEADMLNTYLKAQYGISTAHPGLVKASRTVRTTQFVGKLAFSPLTITRNILDRYSKGLSHGTFLTNARAVVKYPPFLNHWMKSARSIEDQMIRNGAVLGHGHLSEGFSGTEGVISLIAKPFASSERGNQTYIALVKKLQLESDIKRLMEVDGPQGPVSKVFDNLAKIVGQSQKQTRNRVLTSLTNEQLAETYAAGKVDPNVMAEVLHRTTTDSAFPLTLASKRLWWGSRPIVQASTQFKVWSADQTRFIVKDVINYGVKTGDWSRLSRFMVATWLMGEMYNIARDELTNKDESVLSKAKGGTREEIMVSIANGFADGGGIGFLPDITYGLGNWLAGPTTATGAKVFEAVDNARGTATATEAMGQFLMDDVPALRQVQGVLDNLDSIYEENNLTENYARWQGRSRKFRKKKGDKIAGSLLSRTARGIGTKRVSERTLSLDMIARQVLVGDYDDATKHMVRVFEQTEVQDIKKVISSFKQSMRNNSPFGNIAKKDMAEFAAPFTPEEFRQGLEMQLTWNKGYQTALADAAKSLEKRDLDKEAKQYTESIMPEIEKGIKVIEEALEMLQ